MVNISKGAPHYDYLLLASEFSNIPVTGVSDGSTAYLVDTKVMYIFYNGTWYEV